MTRVNVYDYGSDDEYADEPPRRVGWFNPESATAYPEDTYWDGSNHVSMNTRSYGNRQQLHRTKGGQWVLNAWSAWEGVLETYQFLDADAAQEWLMRNKHDDAVAEHFSELAEESGPNLGGRPEVGGRVEVRLGDLLPRVDELATEQKVSRAEMIRRLVEGALSPEELDWRDLTADVES